MKQKRERNKSQFNLYPFFPLSSPPSSSHLYSQGRETRSERDGSEEERGLGRAPLVLLLASGL